MAKEALILNNINLVRKIAYRKSNFCSFNYEDLIQEGVLGLIKGIEKFDINRNTGFATYVYYWVVQSIDRAIYDRGFLVRLPVHIIEKINKINKLEKQYLINDGEIKEDLICQKLDISTNEYNELKAYEQNMKRISSLNQSVISEDASDDGQLLDIIPYSAKIDISENKENINVEDMVFSKFLRIDIDKLLCTLTPREENVIRQRFGLYNEKPKTLEEIGKSYNVTRERVRQIEKKAIRKLRHPSRSKKLRDYLVRC
ncbi:sigma-70 family RNA polymerase sigma factor [Haloimpatiens myeolchijeotgali]